jgi:hypothetical protein
MMRRLLPLLLILVGAPSAAWPCINGTLLEKDEMIKRLLLAEKAIEARDFMKARTHLVLGRDETLLDRRLDQRRRLLLGVVNLRLGKTRAAERTFRAFLRAQKEDPLLRAWLAQSLADRTGFDAVEAWRILDDLERRDLVPEAEAWVALARLRHRDHDWEGRERALRRCRAMARDATTCRLELLASH